MSAIVPLSDEEAYLAALLFDDSSGIELACMTWVDEEQEDRCWRPWEFQFAMWACQDTFQATLMGRSLGKTVGIILEACAFPLNYPGQEMLITAPELNHLQPVVSKVEEKILGIRLLREMLPNRRGNGINKQPQFSAHFANGARIVSRLPNRDGRGVKGQHPLVIRLDEGQDYPEAGYRELVETMKKYVAGSKWKITGVSNGPGGSFYRFTTGADPNLPFKVHRYMAPHRPTWDEDERKAKIAMYGGTEDNIDYKRNIFGEHGDPGSALFVMHRLSAVTRVRESEWASRYNDEVYAQIKINDELLKSSGVPISTFLQFDPSHLDDCYFNFWAGMDVGYTRDPSEILLFGELKHPKKTGESLLRLLSRIHLMRVSAADQAEVVRTVFEHYGPRLQRFSLDRTGNGLPLWQELDPEAVGTHVDNRRTPEHISQRIKGYGFSQKVAVEFDDRELQKDERPEDAVIEKNVVDFAMDELRKVVDTETLELPFDIELLTEWQGQRIEYVRDEGSAAGVKRRKSSGSLHTVDAALMMIAGKRLMNIEEALRIQAEAPQTPVLARFGA